VILLSGRGLYLHIFIRENFYDVIKKEYIQFTGRGDEVFCFLCGNGLRFWIHSDNPWVEHAKRFVYRVYVGYLKGLEFVQDCCDS
jgi:hypothetical protein